MESIYIWRFPRNVASLVAEIRGEVLELKASIEEEETKRVELEGEVNALSNRFEKLNKTAGQISGPKVLNIAAEILPKLTESLEGKLDSAYWRW